MARINGTVGANSSAYEFYVEWTESEVNIENNTSKVTATSYIKCTAHTAYDNTTYAHTVTIDGTVFTVNVAGINLSAGVTKQLATGSKVITHNADGTKNITISANSPNLPNGAGYGPVKGSASGTAALTTIPRATTPTLSASTADLGTNVTINTPGASSSFTHDLSYAIGNLSGTIATGVATNTTWLIPKTLASAIATSTSGIVTITCTTKSGSTVIGTKTINLTVTIPNTSEFKPSIQAVTIKDDNIAVANKFNAYVQNQSKFNILFTRSGVYGSTIIADKITANNQSFNSNSAVTNAISGSGNQNIVCTTTDSRNRSAEITTSVNVLPYQAPLISSFSAVRSNSDGTENNDGTYAKVTINANITALNNLNNKSFKVQYKQSTASTWTVQDVTPASGYTLNTSVVIPNFSVDSTYNIQLLVQDFFATTQSAIINFPTSFTLMDFHSGGKGLAIGKVAEVANAFEVATAMDFIINGTSIFKTKPLPFTADTLANWCSLKTGRYWAANIGLAGQPNSYRNN